MLFPIILALSIYSPHIGEFFTLPWGPNGVDAAHTPQPIPDYQTVFGKSLRLSTDNYAAIFAANEAFLERVNFMSLSGADAASVIGIGISHSPYGRQATTFSLTNSPSRRVVHTAPYDAYRASFAADCFLSSLLYSYPIITSDDRDSGRAIYPSGVLPSSSLLGSHTPSFPTIDWSPVEALTNFNSWSHAVHLGDCAPDDYGIISSNCITNNNLIPTLWYLGIGPNLGGSLDTFPDYLGAAFTPGSAVTEDLLIELCSSNSSRRLNYRRLAAYDTVLAAIDRSFACPTRRPTIYYDVTNITHRCRVSLKGTAPTGEIGEYVTWDSEPDVYTESIGTNGYIYIDGAEQLFHVSRTYTHGAIASSASYPVDSRDSLTNAIYELVEELCDRGELQQDTGGICCYSLTFDGWQDTDSYQDPSGRWIVSIKAWVEIADAPDAYTIYDNYVHGAVTFSMPTNDIPVYISASSDYDYMFTTDPTNTQDTITMGYPSSAAINSYRVKELEVATRWDVAIATNITTLFDYIIEIPEESLTNKEVRISRSVIKDNFYAGFCNFIRSDVRSVRQKVKSLLAAQVDADPASVESYAKPKAEQLLSALTSSARVRSKSFEVTPVRDIDPDIVLSTNLWFAVSNGKIAGYSQSWRGPIETTNLALPSPVVAICTLEVSPDNLDTNVTERAAATAVGFPYNHNYWPLYRVDWNWNTLRLSQP